MPLNINDQDLAIATFLNENSISFSCGHLYFDKEKQQDAFMIGFSTTRSGFSIQYHTGIGHRIDLRGNKRAAFPSIRKLTFKEVKDIKTLKAITKLDSVIWETKDRGFRVVAPTQASVLYCLIADMGCTEYGFSAFCANCGYDEDSRAALDIYLACEKQTKDLRSIFDSVQLDALQELLQDY